MIEQKLPDVEPQVALAKQILARLGDFTELTDDDDLLNNIRQLAEIFVDVGDLRVFPNEISDVFVKCLSSLPVQSTIVGTLLGLIYRRESSFPSLVVQKLGDTFINSMKQNDINTAKISLRSMAALTCSGCLVSSGDGSVLHLLGVFLQQVLSDGAADANKLSIEAKVALYLLSSTLPWIATELIKTSEGCAFVSKTIPILEQFLKEYKSPYDVGMKTPVFHTYVVPVDDDGNEVSADARGVMNVGPDGAACWDSLWASVSVANSCLSELNVNKTFTMPSCMLTPWIELQADLAVDLSGEEWDGSVRSSILSLSTDLAGILRQVFVDGPTEIYFDAPSSSLSQYALDSATLTSRTSTSSSSWLVPIFNVFDSDTADMCVQCVLGTTSLERYMFMEYYRDIIYFFDPVINEDGTRCGSVELLCKHLLAVKKMRSKSEPDVPLESIIIETLFQKVLQVPVNKMQTSLMFRIILELCQKSGDFAQTLALGVHCLFQMLPEMDMTCLREFAQWFAVHLLNTKISWPYWNDWIDTCLEDKLESSRTLFCKIVVDKMGRAVSHDLITSAIPTTLHALLPQDALPNCGLESDAKFGGLFKELRHLIETREEPEVVTEWLEKQKLDDDTIPDEVWRAPLLLQVIFLIAGDVPSAFTNLIERYIDPLRTLSASEHGELALVSNVSDCLNHDQGYLNKVLDILLRRSVLTVTAAAKWATQDEQLNTLATDVWSYKHIELICDRSIDIARAAVSRRRDIGDEMPFDESTDIRPITEFLLESKTKTPNPDDDQDAMEEEEDTETDAINDATEAAVMALKSCRQIYLTIIGNLMDRTHTRDIPSSDGDQVDEWLACASSISRYCANSYDVAEKTFLQTDSMKVVLAAKSAVLDVLSRVDNEGAKEIAKSVQNLNNF